MRLADSEALERSSILPDAADVLVVGGGVVGTACAYHLARRGLKVVLVEQAGIAAGSSSATQSLVGYGLGGDGYHLDLQIAAMRAHDEIVATGLEFDFDRQGALVVPENAADEDALGIAVESRRVRGLACRALSRAELLELEPSVAADGPGGAFLPELAQVSPMRLANALARAAIGHGARVRTRTTILGLERTNAGRMVIETSSGQVRVDRVVVAAGSWSREVGARLGIAIPVWPRKGHVLVAEPARGMLRRPVVDFGYGRAALPPALHDDGPAPGPPSAFGVIQPLPSGQLLIGGSRQFAGFDLSISAETVRMIATRAIRMVPGLRDLRVIRTYVGFRPWTPDGLPLIGESRRHPGVILATGHGGEGITELVVTGRIVADIIGGTDPPLDIGPLAPDRLMA